MLTWQTTLYLAELEKTYAASQFLDANVTFVTERQIAKGWLSRYKLVLVPGVRKSLTRHSATYTPIPLEGAGF